MSLYRSRTINLGEGRRCYLEGRDPEIEHWFDTDALGEHARWILQTRWRYQRMRWWRLDPPPFRFVLIETPPAGPLARIAGRVITWLIVIRSL